MLKGLQSVWLVDRFLGLFTVQQHFYIAESPSPERSFNCVISMIFHFLTDFSFFRVNLTFRRTRFFFVKLGLKMWPNYVNILPPYPSLSSFSLQKQTVKHFPDTITIGGAGEGQYYNEHYKKSMGLGFPWTLQLLKWLPSYLKYIYIYK